ncbi:MAG: response regulator transcription factor [Armatimonadetes bacterium]|nr:response regulator transcription factor [Armatimonadota bacterium]
MQAQALVAAPDPLAAAQIRRELERGGFSVAVASSGAEALSAQRRNRPDLIVLDLVQPDIDGLDVCRRMRTETEAPLIVVTARPAELDRVLALELGADDYIVSPYNPEEFMARVRASLRRVNPRVARMTRDEVLDFGDIKVHRDAHVLTVRDRQVPLTPMEARLMWALAERAGEVVSSESLLSTVWGYPRGVRTRTLDVHIGRLRKKLQEDGRNPRHIITVPRVGYKFRAEGTAD